MGLFDRISKGWTLTMKSLAIVRENKHFLVFTLLSGMSLLLVLGSFIGTVATQSNALDTREPAVKYAVYFLFFVCLAVIALSVICLMSTAETVFIALMYQYSTGKGTGTVSEEDIQGSFARI